MFEMLITGACALVMWPFDLKKELKYTKSELKYARDKVAELHKFIRRENLETKFRNQQ